MPFFSARPHFENRQIVQWMGESINLSGQTNFDLGGYNSYIYDSYEDFLNGVSGATFLSLPLSASTDPISGWSNQTTFSPGIIRIIPPHAVFFSGNTNVITATTQQDVTNYIATSFDSQGTIVWTPFSGITSMSGACTPDFYVDTIHACGTGGTVTIEGNLLVRGETVSATTIIETEILLVEDNNIDLNWGGNHTSAIGGGITVLSGISNTDASAVGTIDSTIKTDNQGGWVLNTSLSVGSGNTSTYYSGVIGQDNLTDSTHTFVNGRDNFLAKSPYGAILGGRSHYMRQPANFVDDGGYTFIIGGSGHTMDFFPGTTWSIPVPNALGFGNGIVGGAQHRMIDSNMSIIMGGYNHNMLTNLNGVILGGQSHIMESGVDNSIILGGQSITADTSNTVYVPYLNISNIDSGSTTYSLGINSNGDVITSPYLSYGDICGLCNYTFTGDTGTTLTVTDGITDVLIEDPIGGVIVAECARCCTEWSVYYVDISIPNTKTEVLDYTTTSYGDVKAIIGNPDYVGVDVTCISSNSTGVKWGGKNYGVNIRLETTPTTNTEPTPVVGVADFKPTNTEAVEVGPSVYMANIKDSSGTKIHYSTLVGVSAGTNTITETSFNTMIYDATHVKMVSSRDSLISESNFSVLLSSKESTLRGDYVTVASSNNVETVSGVEGTSIISGKDIVASNDYTLYTSGLFVDDVNGLNSNSLQVSTPIDSCTLIVTSGGTVGVKVCNPSFDLEVGGSFGATSKSFVIPHPTKEGKRLVHGAIEGPEFGVYVRGEIKGKIIELPEYWTGLVDESTITVQLTAIGGSQNLYIEKIEDNKIYINTSGWFSTPHCYYNVYGERKDIDKIKTEIDA